MGSKYTSPNRHAGGPVVKLPDSWHVELDRISPPHREQIETQIIASPEEDPPLDHPTLERVREIYESLPPVEQDCVWLRYGLGKREAAIGRILNCTQQAAAWRLASAGRKMAARLLLPVSRDDVIALLGRVLGGTVYEPRIETIADWILCHTHERISSNSWRDRITRSHTLDAVIITALLEYRMVSALRTRRGKPVNAKV